MCVLEGARVRARACVIVCAIERRERAEPARTAAGCVHPKHRPVRRESEFKTKTTKRNIGCDIVFLELSNAHF